MKTGVKPKKLYKIGELTEYSGLSRQTLHNYTLLGLIREEERTRSGHRLYGEDVFEKLDRIKMLLRHRPLREVIEIMRNSQGAAESGKNTFEPPDFHVTQDISLAQGSRDDDGDQWTR